MEREFHHYTSSGELDGKGAPPLESMTLATSVAMSPMHVPSGVSGCAAIIAFATWDRRFGSVFNHGRSAVLGVFLVLPLLQFGGDLRGMRTLSRTRDDCDPIMVSLKEDAGHKRSGPIGAYFVRM